MHDDCALAGCLMSRIRARRARACPRRLRSAIDRRRPDSSARPSRTPSRTRTAATRPVPREERTSVSRRRGAGGHGYEESDRAPGRAHVSSCRRWWRLARSRECAECAPEHRRRPSTANSSQSAPATGWRIGSGLHSVNGQGASSHRRFRASLRAESPPDRLGGRRRARGARRDAREALDQARVEGAGAAPRDPDDGPDDARGPGHARQGRRALLEGDPPGSGRPLCAVRRRGLRLPEPRRDRERAARRRAA